MPHVVINGNIAIKDIFNNLKPINIKEKEMLLKTMEIYLSKKKLLF